jgi:hypothetical protein
LEEDDRRCELAKEGKACENVCVSMLSLLLQELAYPFRWV